MTTTPTLAPGDQPVITLNQHRAMMAHRIQKMPWWLTAKAITVGVIIFCVIANIIVAALHWEGAARLIINTLNSVLPPILLLTLLSMRRSALKRIVSVQFHED